MGVRKEMTQLQERVRSILLTDERTRNSDDRLYIAIVNQICGEKEIDPSSISISKFFTTRKEYGFPSYESVGRARRKLQEHDESLRADEKVEQARILRAEDFKEWAIGKMN